MKDVNITNRMLSLIISAGVIKVAIIVEPAYNCLNDKGRVIKMRVHITKNKPSEL